MEIELTFPTVYFAHPQCREEGWHPEKSFHDYLMALEIPDYVFFETFGAHDKHKRYHEYDRVNLVNRLVAVQDDSKCWRLGLKKQTKPQLNFDSEAWGRIERKLPDWFDEVLADKDEVTWHEDERGTATSGAVSLIVSWLFSLQPKRPEHADLGDVPLEKRWRLTAKQLSDIHKCDTTEYVFSPTDVLEKELEERLLDGGVFKSDKKAKSAFYMVDRMSYLLPSSPLQPTLLLRHKYLTESLGKTQADRITLDSYKTLNSQEVAPDRVLPQVLFAVAFVMSLGSRSRELHQLELIEQGPAPQATTNPSMPKGWDWDVFKTLYQTVESPAEEINSETLWGIRAQVHEVLASSSFWMNKFEQVTMHKHLAAWPWIVIWCLAHHDQLLELKTTTDLSKVHDDFLKDFPELNQSGREETGQLFSKVMHAVKVMHTMGGYQQVLSAIVEKLTGWPEDVLADVVEKRQIWWVLGQLKPQLNKQTDDNNKFGL